MMTSNIRQHVHSLVDEADEAQLEAVLAVFNSNLSSAYSQAQIDGFYDRLQAFEENGNVGYAVEEVKELVRKKSDVA